MCIVSGFVWYYEGALNACHSSVASVTYLLAFAENVDELKAYLKTMEDDLAAQRDLTAAIEAELRVCCSVELAAPPCYRRFRIALVRFIRHERFLHSLPVYPFRVLHVFPGH